VTVEESVVVPRPPAEVYDVVADLERAPEWQSSLVSVDLERGVEVRTFAGQRREATFEVKEQDRPERFGIESRSGLVRAHALFTLTPVGEGTRVVVRLDVEVGGTGGRLATAMLRGRVAREARQNLERLTELLKA
jgi:carbon monoxide dehydrogenase subunit G